MTFDVRLVRPPSRRVSPQWSTPPPGTPQAQLIATLENHTGITLP
ncbi:hypothetical protein AB0451_40185 [Streptomyces sp. NPDC052000]